MRGPAAAGAGAGRLPAGATAAHHLRDDIRLRQVRAELDRIAQTETNSRIATVLTAGSWSCRSIDIYGFVLSVSWRILVERGWASCGFAGRFLRAAGKAACWRFGVVLEPPADRFHQDHLHVDIGPWKRCGV